LEKKYFGGFEGLKKVISICITKKRVSLETQVNDNLTIEDIQKNGVIFLQPIGSSDTDTFYVVIPLIILDRLNTAFFIWNEISLLDPLKGVWNWNRFEEWECVFELIKNNAAVWAESIDSPVSFFYTSASQRADEQWTLCQMEAVVHEQHQFLAEGAQPTEIIKISSGRTIKGEDLTKYSFRCAPGNPLVDSRVFRNGKNSGLPWMICKQTKHSIETKNSLSLTQLEKAYEKFKVKMEPYWNSYCVFYVLITNRTMSIEDTNKFIVTHHNVCIINKKNFTEYYPTTFSSYSIFDDIDEDDEDHPKNIIRPDFSVISSSNENAETGQIDLEMDNENDERQSDNDFEDHENVIDEDFMDPEAVDESPSILM